MTRSHLIENFNKFKNEPSRESRIELVSRICEDYNNFSFQDNEKQILNEILIYLANDIEVRIRSILAETLKNNHLIPRKLAKKLANDIAEVSSPILQFNEVLSDEDLKQIIEATTETAKLMSIANRRSVSENISYALIDKKMDEITIALLENKGADLNDHCKERIFSAFSSSKDVLDTMVKRGGLSISLACRMVSYVSDSIASELNEKYSLNEVITKRVLAEAEEQYNIDIIGNKLNKEKTRELVRHLNRSNKLSHSVILRALCRGDLEFFYYGITILAKINYSNTVTLIETGDEKAFESLFKAANMPTTMYKASYILLNMIRNSPQNGRSSQEYFDDIINKIHQNEYDKTIANMRYFIALINSIKNG